MADLTIKIEAPDLAHAILELASVLAMAVSTDAAKFSMAHPQPAVTLSAADMLTSSSPVAQTIAPVAAAALPVALNQMTPPAVIAQQQETQQAISQAFPTAAHTYAMQDLAVAATQLMDAGRLEELRGLLGQFGVQALTGLPQEQYGAFATGLRALGARL